MSIPATFNIKVFSRKILLLQLWSDPHILLAKVLHVGGYVMMSLDAEKDLINVFSGVEQSFGGSIAY